MRLVNASPGEFARRAALETARLIAAAQGPDGRASVAFSGGSTVGPVFDELVALAVDPSAAEAPEDDATIDWARVLVAQVDERAVPLDHPDRNAAVLIERLVDALPVRPGAVELLPVELVGAGDWSALARRRLSEIAGDPPVFDVIQLGLGPDGHTASLVPGDPVLDAFDEPVALTAPYQGHQRLTMTYPVLNRAAARVWWVEGAEEGQPKAQAAVALLAGDPSVPAGRVTQVATTVVTDAVLDWS